MAATQADLLAAQVQTANEVANLSLQVTNLIARIKNRPVVDQTAAVANENATRDAVKQAADALAAMEPESPAATPQ